VEKNYASKSHICCIHSFYPQQKMYYYYVPTIFFESSQEQSMYKKFKNCVNFNEFLMSGFSLMYSLFHIYLSLLIGRRKHNLFVLFLQLCVLLRREMRQTLSLKFGMWKTIKFDKKYKIRENHKVH
jgi:hypothetical protein